MANPQRGFQLVEDDQVEIRQPAAPPAPEKAPILNRVSVEMLSMAISALSQRALTALASLFTLLTVGSAFYLWMSIPDPNEKQIISLTIYAVLVLSINVIVRRK